MLDFSEFIFTHKEMAQLLGISPNALRMRLRAGNHDDLEMRVINGKKMYKRPGDIKAVRPPGRWNNQTPVSGHALNRSGAPVSGSHNSGARSKKPVRRGNHFNAKYPNYALEKANEIKMLTKLTNKSLHPDIVDLVPDAIKVAQERRYNQLERKRRAMLPKNYGGLYNCNEPRRFKSIRYYADPDGTTLFERPKDEYDRALEELEKDGAFRKKGPYEI